MAEPDAEKEAAGLFALNVLKLGGNDVGPIDMPGPMGKPGC
jgi:hypothetical protein